MAKKSTSNEVLTLQLRISALYEDIKNENWNANVEAAAEILERARVIRSRHVFADFNRVTTLVDKTESAYSFDRYGRSIWTDCIWIMVEKGLEDNVIYEILCSKHMRWAADNMQPITPAGFRKYFEKNLKKRDIEDLMKASDFIQS